MLNIEIYKYHSDKIYNFTKNNFIEDIKNSN